MAYNIINVSFGGIRKITGPSISYRHDIKQILVIHDQNLPNYYEVDFCNDGDSQTITMVATSEGVQIPDELLVNGKAIKAYVVIPQDESVSTRREITLPVNNRPERSDIQPTPAEQEQIDSLVAALTDGVSRAEDAAEMLENVSAETETLEPGSAATAEYENGVFRFGIPEGLRGETGPRGETGQRGEKGETGDTGPQGEKGDPFTYEDFTEAEKAELVQGPILDAQTAAVAAVGTARVNAVNDVNSAGSTQVGNVNTAGTEKLNAVNTAGTNQVAAVNSAGSTQVDAVNSAGATQVGLVQTEGDAQIQAVEDKGEEVLESIPSDYTALSAQVQILTDTKAPVIVDTASGDIASFGDGADGMPIQSLIATINPVQDLHGYDNPWPAGGGKNKFDVEALPNGTDRGVFKLSDGSIKVIAPASSGGVAPYKDGYMKLSDLAPNLVVGQTYTLSFISTGTQKHVYLAKSQFRWDSGSARTITQDDLDSIIYFYASGTSTEAIITDFQIELGSTATSFTPYSNICPISGRTGMELSHSGADTSNPDVIPISWQSEAGTVYGATLDAVTGVLTVDRGYATLTKDSSWSWNAGNALAICAVRNGIIVNASNQTVVFANNNMFTPSAWVGRSAPEYSCGMMFGASYVFVRSANHISSVDDLKTVLGDNTLQVVYPLATPTTVQLTPQEVTTLLGENNIWTDVGSVSVVAPRDTKLYIDRKIAEALS